MKYRHVIWDYDGTLFDSYPVMASAFCAALEERGISEPVTSIIAAMKVSMGHAIRQYREQYRLDDAFFEHYKALNINAELENTKPFAGAAELCHSICSNGGQNYLFTHRGESAEHFIEKFGLTACFTELITSKQGFPRKPSPNAILHLMNKYDFSERESIMIGDRELDILSAENAGIHSCYFANGNGVSDIARVNINCFSELYRILGIAL